MAYRAYEKVLELRNELEIRQDEGKGLSGKAEARLIELLNECFKIVDRRK
jgi:hypothetical protein